MIKQFVFLAALLLCIAPALGAAQNPNPNASFVVIGTVVYACTNNGEICTTNAAAAQLMEFNCSKMTNAVLYVDTGDGLVIPSYCGYALACQCWSLAYKNAGAEITVHGRLYPDGEATLNWVTSIRLHRQR